MSGVCFSRNWLMDEAESYSFSILALFEELYQVPTLKELCSKLDEYYPIKTDSLDIVDGCPPPIYCFYRFMEEEMKPYQYCGEIVGEEHYNVIQGVEA